MEDSIAPDPPLFTLPHNPRLGTDDLSSSPSMARQSQIASLHSRHQSVPAFPLPQGGGQSRGLAKLTLVERLSKESIPSAASGDENINIQNSSKGFSLVRFNEDSPRPSHSPRRNRMSITLPPTKSATDPVNSSPVANTPLRSTPLPPVSPVKHVSNGSLGEITMSPTHGIHDRAMSSPTLPTPEDIAGLDDANATFLTLVAFQERRVVELREELARAESELDFLKQQWTRQQLKLTSSARQQHVRQNSLTKLEQQINTGSYTGTPRTDRQEEFRSPQILAAGKRLAEGVKEGFFSMMDDLKAVAANESAQTTTRQRGRSPTKRVPNDAIFGVVGEKPDPPLWYPKRSSSPMKRITSQESDPSDISDDTLSSERLPHTTLLFDHSPSRSTSISSTTSAIKSPALEQIAPLPSRSPYTDSTISPWAWTMASRILHQSQRHATTFFGTVERHLDSLAAGPESPLHPRRPRRYPSRTFTDRNESVLTVRGNACDG